MDWAGLNKPEEFECNVVGLSLVSLHYPHHSSRVPGLTQGEGESLFLEQSQTSTCHLGVIKLSAVLLDFHQSNRETQGRPIGPVGVHGFHSYSPYISVISLRN